MIDSTIKVCNTHDILKILSDFSRRKLIYCYLEVKITNFSHSSLVLTLFIRVNFNNPHRRMRVCVYKKFEVAINYCKYRSGAGWTKCGWVAIQWINFIWIENRVVRNLDSVILRKKCAIRLINLYEDRRCFKSTMQWINLKFEDKTICSCRWKRLRLWQKWTKTVEKSFLTL